MRPRRGCQRPVATRAGRLRPRQRLIGRPTPSPAAPKRPAADYMELPTASAAPAGRVIPCASSRLPAAGAAVLASCARGRPAPGSRTRARPALWRFASIENGRCGPRAWRAGARPGSGAAEDGERYGGVIGSCLYCASRLSGVPRPRLPSSRAGDGRRGRTRRGASWTPSPRRASIPAACTTPRASTAGKCPGPCAAATAKAGRARGAAYYPPRQGSKRGRLGGPLRGGLAILDGASDALDSECVPLRRCAGRECAVSRAPYTRGGWQGRAAVGRPPEDACRGRQGRWPRAAWRQAR